MNTNDKLELNLMLTTPTELSEQDLEPVTAGKEAMGFLMPISSLGGFTGTMATIRIPNFFGS